MMTTSCFGILAPLSLPIGWVMRLPCSLLVGSMVGMFSGVCTLNISLGGEPMMTPLFGLNWTSSAGSDNEFHSWWFLPTLNSISWFPHQYIQPLVCRQRNFSRPRFPTWSSLGFGRSWISSNFLTFGWSRPTTSRLRKTIHLWITHCVNHVPWHWCTTNHCQ